MNSAKSKRRACHHLEQLPETRIPFLFLRGVDTSIETRPYLQSSVFYSLPFCPFFPSANAVYDTDDEVLERVISTDSLALGKTLYDCYHTLLSPFRQLCYSVLFCNFYSLIAVFGNLTLSEPSSLKPGCFPCPLKTQLTGKCPMPFFSCKDHDPFPYSNSILCKNQYWLTFYFPDNELSRRINR